MARGWSLLWCLVVFGVPARGFGADVPVAGKQMTLRARVGAPAARRNARIVLKDGAIAAPLPDPRAGGATAVVHGGVGAGRCFAAVDLPAAGWSAYGTGDRRRYRFRDPSAPSGVDQVILGPGRIVVRARGAAWPCDLAAAQRVPVGVRLVVGATRYCASFGGFVRRNDAGGFAARQAPAPAGCPASDVSLANLNVLHGLFCPGPTASCRAADRWDLIFQHLVAAGCPDVVTFQEIWNAQVPLIDARLPGACGYTKVYVQSNGIDDELVLSRHPTDAPEVVKLHGNFRTAFHVQLDHPLGPVDVFATHLASGSDGGGQPCSSCPSECVAAGAVTTRDCQAVQLAALVEARHLLPTPALVAGDFNQLPGSFAYDAFAGRGWLDSYLAAGNPECVPGTGVGCTSGREDEALDEMESPALNEDARIDFAFVVPPGAGTCHVDAAGDADGDGRQTALFAETPNPFALSCGPAPDPICWPSDHVGTRVDLDCF